MRVKDAQPKVAPRVEQSATRALSPEQVSSLSSGVDLGWFPTSGEACSLLGRAANALAALFSIVDFGDQGSIVDFGDRGSIVDFGDGKGIVDDVAE